MADRETHKSDEQSRPGTEGRRGKLKIFLGPAPGVGKTYAMLQAAIQRAEDGRDVAVGALDTHGRPELERLVRRLENAARRAGRTTTLTMPELDVGAALARAPNLLLIDDLQLWSTPRVDHALRRHQIVERAIEAGINVFATLDVQCLESVNERIARISNVRMRDTVPDGFLELADEIELVDLPPEQLIQRLRDGKVHVADHINRSMRRFFSRRNLNALREAAMRITADRLDAQVGGGGAFSGPTRDHILVCIDETPLALKLVRTARRLAEPQHIPWTVLYVQTRRFRSLDEASKERVARSMKMAERWGAEAITLTAETGVAEEILSYAESRRFTRILVGRSRVGLWPRLLRRSVSDKLLTKTRNAEVTLVMPETPEEREGGAFPDLARGGRTLSGFAVASLAVAGALGVAHILELFMPVPNITLVFLAAVVLVAVRVGLWPSIYASFLSLLVFNFFLTEPYYTLSVTHEEDLLTIAFFLVMATLTGNLASTVRSQVEAIRRSARRIENLYDFSRRVAAAVSLDDTLWAVVSHVASTLGCRSLLLLPGENDALEIVSGYPPEDHLESVEWTAAEKAWKSAQPAGWSQPEDEGGAWLFLPLKTASGPLGLLGVAFEDQNSVLAPEQLRLLDAVADQAAVAIERTQLTTDIEEARILSETEQLRSALLSSVSHDLRTPLVSIIGSSTTLTNFGASLSEDDRRELAQTILDESQRLNRFVQNLLDMTRLGYGVLQPKRDWVELREIVGRALHDLGRATEGYEVEIRISDRIPMLYVDTVLIGQVLVNLLDNALKYTPAGGRIVIGGEIDGANAAVSVSDSGRGVPEADRAAIFDMFYRVRSGDKEARGTGLGLAICKGLVLAHGGSIEALPGPDGRGTTFRFLVPLRDLPPIPDLADDGEA